MANSHNDLPDLDRWLEAHDNPGAELKLSRVEVAALRRELSRLLQSAEFLRKQNKKLRGRIAKMKGGELEDEPADPHLDVPPSDADSAPPASDDVE